MLKVTKFVGKGATRICFEHPGNADKCVKVIVRFKDENLLYKELETYKKVGKYLSNYLLSYDPDVVDTNIGKAVVCEFLRDDDGEISKGLGYYCKEGKIDKDLLNQIDDFANILVKENIFFYDFNIQNFMVQIKDGKKQLKYTDLKSYNNYKPWTFLKLEKMIKPLAKSLMLRRLKKLHSRVSVQA